MSTPRDAAHEVLWNICQDAKAALPSTQGIGEQHRSRAELERVLAGIAQVAQPFEDAYLDAFQSEPSSVEPSSEERPAEMAKWVSILDTLSALYIRKSEHNRAMPDIRALDGTPLHERQREAADVLAAVAKALPTLHNMLLDEMGRTLGLEMQVATLRAERDAATEALKDAAEMRAYSTKVQQRRWERLRAALGDDDRKLGMDLTIDAVCDALRASRASLAAVRADTERLDWMEAHRAQIDTAHDVSPFRVWIGDHRIADGVSVRDAINRARAASTEGAGNGPEKS